MDLKKTVMAGGFSLDPKNIGELRKRIENDLDYMDCPDVEEDETIDIDALLRPEEFNQNTIRVIERFEPYGEQNGPIVMLIEGARIDTINTMPNSKDKAQAHLRITLSYGSHKWPGVFWSAGPRVGHDFDERDNVDVVFRLGRNYYKNQEMIQLTILDIRRH